MYGKTGTACISLTQNAQKSDQVLDKVRAPYNRSFVRSFVRPSVRVTHAQNTKSVKQLNNRGRTNPLRKKASALRLCRIFFAAEPCSRSAFLFLRSLVSALCERTHNGKHAGTCRGKRLAAGASPSADFIRYFRTFVPSLSAQIFFCCVGTLFARGIKDAGRTTLSASMPYPSARLKWRRSLGRRVCSANSQDI